MSKMDELVISLIWKEDLSYDIHYQIYWFGSMLNKIKWYDLIKLRHGCEMPSTSSWVNI